MNMSPTPPSSHRHSRHLHQDTHHSPQDHFSITRVPEPGRAYPLNAVRHSSRDDLSYTSQTTSYPDQPRYSRHLMQSQSDRRCQCLSYVCLYPFHLFIYCLFHSQLAVSPHDERTPSPTGPAPAAPSSDARPKCPPT